MVERGKENIDHSIDDVEISEWIESLDAVVQNHGRNSAKFILEAIENRAKELRVLYDPLP